MTKLPHITRLMGGPSVTLSLPSACLRQEHQFQVCCCSMIMLMSLCSSSLQRTYIAGFVLVFVLRYQCWAFKRAVKRRITQRAEHIAEPELQPGPAQCNLDAAVTNLRQGPWCAVYISASGMRPGDDGLEPACKLCFNHQSGEHCRSAAEACLAPGDLVALRRR